VKGGRANQSMRMGGPVIWDDIGSSSCLFAGRDREVASAVVR
jgi:hypothetical protein